MQHVAKPRKEKENVSHETLRRRRNRVTLVIENQFGVEGQDYVISELIRRKGQEERAELLKQMGLGGEMTEEDGLAMIVDLGTTWNMFRRWKK